MTKLDEPVDESEFIKIFYKCLKIPDKSQEQNKDWPLKVVDQFERLCNRSKSTKLSFNIKIILKKLIGDNNELDICESSFSKKFFISYLNVSYFLINIIPECYGKKNKIYLSKIFLDFIFYTPGLYKDIILYHENFKITINSKVEEFIDSTDSKYYFYKEYLQEYNKHAQNILLF